MVRYQRRRRPAISQHAGDRRSFEAMLAAGGRDDRIEMEERKAYYRSGSAIWGVRAKVQFLTLCLRPSTEMPGRIDILQISGFIDFERLRADVPWIMRRLWTSDTEGTPDTKLPPPPPVPRGRQGHLPARDPRFLHAPAA